MKILIIFNVVILLLNLYYLVQIWFASRAITESYNGHRVDLELLKFNNYLKNFNKSYSSEEYENRFQIFKFKFASIATMASMRKPSSRMVLIYLLRGDMVVQIQGSVPTQDSLAEIARLNALEEATVFGLTKFSDMSPKEFLKIMLKRDKCTKINATCRDSYISRKSFNYFSNGLTPIKFDWREHGCLSPVLDQKLCSGCWAFSIVGVMECMASRKNISHERLSIQELLDCTVDSHGCQGGYVSKALDEFCRQKYPVTTEENYPLTLKEKRAISCVFPTSGVRIKEYGYQCLVDEREMALQVANYGPLVSIINGAPLQNYFGGIIRRACVRNDNSPAHAVQIIGYDTSGIIPFYILKNSYGEDFGENGYFRLAMYENVCGIREEVSYIDVE